MNQTNHIDLSKAHSFAFWSPVTIRYSDQDELGHINNCSYIAYVEAGRVAFLGGLLDPASHAGIDFILAHIAVAITPRSCAKYLFGIMACGPS